MNTFSRCSMEKSFEYRILSIKLPGGGAYSFQALSRGGIHILLTINSVIGSYLCRHFLLILTLSIVTVLFIFNICV